MDYTLWFSIYRSVAPAQDGRSVAAPGQGNPAFLGYCAPSDMVKLWPSVVFAGCLNRVTHTSNGGDIVRQTHWPHKHTGGEQIPFATTRDLLKEVDRGSQVRCNCMQFTKGANFMLEGLVTQSVAYRTF